MRFNIEFTKSFSEAQSFLTQIRKEIEAGKEPEIKDPFLKAVYEKWKFIDYSREFGFSPRFNTIIDKLNLQQTTPEDFVRKYSPNCILESCKKLLKPGVGELTFKEIRNFIKRLHIEW